MEDVLNKLLNHAKIMVKRAVEAAVSHGELPPFHMPDGTVGVPEVPVEVPREHARGDVASTFALTAARAARRNPREVASIIAAHLGRLTDQGDCQGGCALVAVEVAGPGFINMRFDRSWLWEVLEVIHREGDRYGTGDLGKGTKVQVEFVSANPTGPMNVVNARAAAVGDVIARLLAATGHDVQREFYVNDAGRQVDILAQSVEIRYRQALGEDVDLPEDCYRGGYIADLAREADAGFGGHLKTLSPADRREWFKEFAISSLVRMQKEALSAYGVEFDRWFSERTLHQNGAVGRTLARLREAGQLYDRDGAVWLATTRFGDEKDRVVVKSDGSYTYLACDLAYHEDKFSRGFDHVIDIWGPDHHGYVARTQAGVQALGHPAGWLEVVLLQLVTLMSGGEVAKMSKRQGQFVTMDELLREVGRDAARYFFVARSPDSHLEFDLELAKKQSLENPVYYIQYAHARIVSIGRQARERGVAGTTLPDRGAPEGDLEPRPSRDQLALLRETEEEGIIRKLAEYPGEVVRAAQERAPHRIASYGLDLAGLFHSYYNVHRVIGSDPDLSRARLFLAAQVQTVLRNVLAMLGVSAPTAM